MESVIFPSHAGRKQDMGSGGKSICIKIFDNSQNQTKMVKSSIVLNWVLMQLGTENTLLMPRFLIQMQVRSISCDTFREE